MSSYLGQNFLSDSSILTRIAEQVDKLFISEQCDTLIEIGPGKGALTKRILGLTSRTMLIEYDQKMIEYLEHSIFPALSHRPTIIHQDILQRDEHLDFPFGQCTDQIKNTTLVVGNLPYYITSPILRKFFASTHKTRAGGVFLIQKEVAEKIVHDAPKKSFLRWCINYAYDVQYAFSVPAKAFTPPPKVTSAVIRVVPKYTDTIPQLSYSHLLEFLDHYSPYKRKTLGASHKIVKKHHPDTTYDITPYASRRLEELGWEEMEKIII